jgi:hypothetical protein
MVAVLGALHAHVSQYEFYPGRYLQQSQGGAGLELVAFLGSRKRNFTFGGALSFVYVPKSTVEFDDVELEGFSPSAFAFDVGPGADYRLGKSFHIGGLMGLAVERVPPFGSDSSDEDTLLGFGATLWLGFEWKIAERTAFGILTTGHVRQQLNRDLDAIDGGQNAEASLGLGLGVSLTRF